MFLSLIPILFLLIALTTLLTASSWPITLPINSLSIAIKRLLSWVEILLSGIPVIIETTSEIKSTPTSVTLTSRLVCQSTIAFSKLSVISFSLSRSFAASSYCCFFTTSAFFSFISFFSSSSSLIASGFSTEILVVAPASSKTSIALSGIALSIMYLADNLTHSSIASSVYLTLWCFSYFSLMFIKIVLVCSKVGSSTRTCWKRLVNAPSFSMFSRYSSSVVAPMICISPLAKAGLKILDASKEPLEFPAPTIVCNSSMNNTMSGLALHSSNMAFILSSNCPRYFVPATIEAKSNMYIFLPVSVLGALPSKISWASPSTMAVFPTPGSPIRTGLFFFLLDKIWDTRFISISLPTTGSTCSFSTALEISLQKLSKTGVFVFESLFLGFLKDSFSSFSSLLKALFLCSNLSIFVTVFKNLLYVIPISDNILINGNLESKILSITCVVSM